MAFYMPLYAALSWTMVEDYPGWYDFNAYPAVVLGNVLLFGAVLLHSWVGVRDVIIDYVRPTALRITLLALLAVSLGVMGLWILRIYMVLTL